MFRVVAPSRSRTAWQSPPLPSNDNDDSDLMDLDDGEDGEGKKLASPGEVITSAAQFMRGHGTFVEDNDLVASVSGQIERVNKLVSVRALRTRYNPEVGDLVVGRITEVMAQRWKVDINGRQDAILRLSSINLPGGVQRRKLESDELQMRTFFEESDLLVAEVQPIMGDGAISLHTRSLKYGKLRNGLLIPLPPTLIRRRASHFTTLPCGIDLILGMNGYIWVSKHVAAPSTSTSTSSDDNTNMEEGFDAQAVYSNQNDPIDPETRTAISLTANLIRAFARHGISITEERLAEAYDFAVGRDVGPGDVVGGVGEVADGVVMAMGL